MVWGRVDLFHLFLGVHISLGGIALVIAPLAMVTVKGGRWHRRWGKIYFWAMAGVAATASVLCWLRSGIFLFLIAILSFYLALTGYRALRRKLPGSRAEWPDYLAAVVLALAGIGFIVLGLASEEGSRRWVRLAFGGISLLLGVSDVTRFLGPPPGKRAWFFSHMSRFLGAYVATVTAFSVVNFQFLPYFWRWLGPTMVGTVGILIWRNYYQRRREREDHGIVQ
jgi:uncharacterized membrane protein